MEWKVFGEGSGSLVSDLSAYKLSGPSVYVCVSVCTVECIGGLMRALESFWAVLMVIIMLVANSKKETELMMWSSRL